MTDITQRVSISRRVCLRPAGARGAELCPRAPTFYLSTKNGCDFRVARDHWGVADTEGPGPPPVQAESRLLTFSRSMMLNGGGRRNHEEVCVTAPKVTRDARIDDAAIAAMSLLLRRRGRCWTDPLTVSVDFE